MITRKFIRKNRVVRGPVYESLGVFLGLSVFCLCTLPALAQTTQSPLPIRTSELGRENLSRVAASPVEIRVVLRKDPGLMLELKRWVAKDATDHGQIVSDSDLTDDAIFQRLESDVPFRSAATTILQHYGYLLPSLNPDSPLGKEQELLLQERTKWLAQSQEEERTQARQRFPQSSQNARFCDPQIDLDCRASQQRSSPRGGPEIESSPGEQPLQTIPGGPTPQNPPRNDADQILHAQLTETQENVAGSLPQFPSGSSYTSPGVSPVSANAMRTLAPQATSPGSDIQSDGLFSLGSPDIRSATEGIPTDESGMMGAKGASEDSSASANRESAAMLSAANSTVVPMQPPNRRYQQRTLREPAELVRKPNPYSDIPSLYDMYLQAVSRPPVPTRFGTEVFQNGSRNPQLIPMDLPAGPDYVVGPGDGLSISLWGGVSQRLYRTVDREGRVSLPEVGPVLVTGKSLADVQENVQRLLRTQFRDVSADVSLSRLRTIRVYEVGDVANPGAYDISSLSTPLNALFAAGGPTQKGSLRIVKHYRGNQLVQTVDLYDLLLHGVNSDLEHLENGDSLLVPPVGPQVTVEGMVRRPAIYELKNEKTLAGVLELAGGMLPTAALRHIEVQRLVAHDKQTMLSVDIPESASPSEVTAKLESFEIRDGDRLRIFPIAPYNQDAVYLEGHVIRPGRYSYHKDLRITDLISSYKDLLPEPATQYGEIIRLNAPDFRPSVESFNLADALANPSQAPALQPMDTVRIFSRYDFENPPSVSVLGDVRNPGTFRTSGQIHVSDAVHLAGGLAPDAQTEDAQVFRPLPDGKFKIFSVNLNQALSGDPMENIVLLSRDRLLIHRATDATEPAAVYIQGDVAKPGRYPLTVNMRVADLIRVGGGLKPSADTQSADLTHFQWSDQAKFTGQHDTIGISAALAGDPKANLPLANGDVLTIRQLPGWNDLGSSIAVKGEVQHAGTFGIRPGERLSSVLMRAGGFGPEAYPYSAVLMRREVRDMETKSYMDLMQRVKSALSELKATPDPTDPDQRNAKLTAVAQTETTLRQLEANAPIGRVVIHIDTDIHRWQNTPTDIPVRAGDELVIPKKSDYVMVNGQVYNPTAVSYRPGKSAKWYLSQSGGYTPIADKDAVFVVRGDGSVISAKNTSGWWSGNPLDATLRPGDYVVVPEKAPKIAGRNWTNILQAAQVASSVAIAVAYIHP